MAICRRCGAGLVEGENWWLSDVKINNYICIKCRRFYAHQYCAEHRAEKAEYDRQYYTEHREKRLEYARQYRAEHCDERLEYARQWYKANHAHKLEQSRQWAKANPDKRREKWHRYRARKLNATIEQIDEMAIYECYNYVCIYCGGTERDGRRMTLDHIIALNNGGSHCEDNLVIACKGCNSSKGDMPLEDWLQTQPKARVWAM